MKSHELAQWLLLKDPELDVVIEWREDMHQAEPLHIPEFDGDKGWIQLCAGPEFSPYGDDDE